MRCVPKCAMCGKTHYMKTTTFFDRYKYKDGREVHTWDTPHKSGYLCKQCSKKVTIEKYNHDRAYMAVEKAEV